MTYRTNLANLLDIAIQKSETYFEVGGLGDNKNVPLNGSNAEILKKAKDECEAARSAYLAFLKFIETNQISLDDKMPD